MKHDKTPWNPSKKQTARVKAKLHDISAPHACNICGSDVEIVNNQEIYGVEHGEWPWAYRCVNRKCNAYVGMHPFTAIPLGTLADARLRKARKLAHAAFDPLFKDGEMTRSQAYQWLADRLEIKCVTDCHIAWMDVEACEKVRRVCIHREMLAT